MASFNSDRRIAAMGRSFKKTKIWDNFMLNYLKLDHLKSSCKSIIWRAKGESSDNNKSNEKDGRAESLPANLEDVFGGSTLVLALCFLAVSLDPLFLYIPLINEDKKCLMLDKKFMTTAFVLRLLVEIPATVRVVCALFLLIAWPCSYCPAVDDHALDKRPSKLVLTLRLALAVFPLPQIVVPAMGGSTYLKRTKILNSLILLQYLIQGYPIYSFCKNFNKVSGSSKNRSWIPCLVNFALYILASHVAGALWYFFSIQREMACWISACQKEAGCDFSTFHCDRSSTSRNITLLNDLCPTNPPDATIFDFGIFLAPIQSGLVGSTNFPQKLLQCFLWGLRNLSSFASNLNTSNYTWEILFVIFISISGLLLFIYLLGHLQTFMQASNRYKVLQKTRILLPEIEFMVSEYGLRPRPCWKEEIFTLVKNRLQVDEYLEVDNIFSILPEEHQKKLKHRLFSDVLKKVPRFEYIDETTLEAIMAHLVPKNYTADSYIIREGEPLDKMIFITQGSVLVYNTNCVGCGGNGLSNATRLVKGDFYGEELITAASTSSSFPQLPISAKTVRSYKKVEVFIIKVDDLQSVFTQFST